MDQSLEEDLDTHEALIGAHKELKETHSSLLVQRKVPIY
jgi:hypothetical protein